MRKKGAKGAKASDFKRAKAKIMTKLCPRGKSAAPKCIRQHMLMLMLVKFVQVKLKILLELKEKILKDVNLLLWVA